MTWIDRPEIRIARKQDRLTAETHLVWGREDKLVPPIYAGRWQELIPGARLSWIDGAGHMLTLEQPGAVASALGA